mmetsp:Transcript_50583/g.168928  ORF Transcript_50583/g.168928 Transcript_50583/m.168928 type:complete len:219 (-) Transcript_50583:3-659(-)
MTERLGRHPVRSANHRPPLRHGVLQLRDNAEVGELDLPARVEQHVRRLDVAVDHLALRVQVIQPAQHAAADVRDARLVKAAAALAHDVEAASRLAVLHHHPQRLWGGREAGRRLRDHLLRLSDKGVSVRDDVLVVAAAQLPQLVVDVSLGACYQLQHLDRNLLALAHALVDGSVRSRPQEPDQLRGAPGPLVVPLGTHAWQVAATLKWRRAPSVEAAV